MSPVEAFVTRIKMESSNQRSWSRDQGKLWGTNINQSICFFRYWGGVATFLSL